MYHSTFRRRAQLFLKILIYRCAINQNLSPEYRGPSLEALKSEQDYDNKDSVYLNFYQVVQTLSLYLGPRVSRLETVNSVGFYKNIL